MFPEREGEFKKRRGRDTCREKWEGQCSRGTKNQSDQAERLLGGDPVWEIIRSCKQSGRRGASKTKRGMENLRLASILTPTSRLPSPHLSCTSLSSHLYLVQEVEGGLAGAQTALQCCAGAGSRWLLLVCRRQLGNIWELCRPVVSILKLALVGVFIP